MHSQLAGGMCARTMFFSQWNGSMWCTPPGRKDKKKETIKYQGPWQDAFRSCDCWWLTGGRKLMGHVLLSCHFNSKHFWFLHLLLEVNMLGSTFSGGSTHDNFGRAPGPIFFIFMQFWGKNGQIIGWCPLWGWHPRGSGKSWITGKEIIVSCCWSLQLKYSGIKIRKK